MIEIKPTYTLYEIKVPTRSDLGYTHLLKTFQGLFHVIDIEERCLWIGISYENEKEQEKLLEKLTQELEHFYRK